MANRRNGKRRTTIGGTFAPRLIEMIASPAWRVLSLSARRILDRLEIELASHGGTDNGNLPCTYDHFEEYGVERHCIAPAFRELVNLGFVEIKPGVPGDKEIRRPNLFRLTYRHTDKSNPTDDWRCIRNDQDAVELACVARLPIKRGRPIKNRRPMRETPTVTVRETPTETPNLQ